MPESVRKLYEWLCTCMWPVDITVELLMIEFEIATQAFFFADNRKTKR
jgi:hypothetical protein